MEVDFYETSRGESPVTEYLDNTREVPYKAKKKIMKKIDQLLEYGPNQMLRTGDVEQLTSNLLQLRVWTQKCWYRLIFTIYKSTCYFLLVFKKKSNKTPSDMINKAEGLRQQLLLQFKSVKGSTI